MSELPARGATRAALWTTVVLAGLVTALPVRAAAQSDPARAEAGRAGAFPGHGVRIEPGVRWEGIDDALASASRYRARSQNVAAGYRYRSDRWRAGLAGSWTASRLLPSGLESPDTYEEALFITVDSWLTRRVWASANGRWAAFAGPAAAVDVGLRRHEYGGQRSYRYDNAFVGLEAAGILEWTTPGGVRLSERIMLPLGGLAVRTGYTALASEGVAVSFDLPPDLLLFRHRLEARLPLRRWLALSAHHEGSLLRHDHPLELAQAWHRVGVAVEFAWGG